MWLTKPAPFWLLGFLIAACGPSQSPDADATEAPADSSLRTEVVREVESLNAMRSRLAQTITSDENVDQATFARVCRPVGKRAQEMARTHGWTVRQIAARYRNPANRLEEGDAEVFERFARAPERLRLWTRDERNGTAGWHYYRRIVVEPSCLACHGAREERPAFVRDNYPEDAAYGFEVGDLRGLYAVFIADSLQAVRTGASFE